MTDSGKGARVYSQQSAKTTTRRDAKGKPTQTTTQRSKKGESKCSFSSYLFLEFCLLCGCSPAWFSVRSPSECFLSEAIGWEEGSMARCIAVIRIITAAITIIRWAAAADGKKITWGTVDRGRVYRTWYTAPGLLSRNVRNPVVGIAEAHRSQTVPQKTS